MRNLYILFTVTMILIVLLIVSAFLFLEKEKHRVFYYTVKSRSEKVGYIKIDRYKTEDKIIYKSISFLPRNLDSKITHERLIFDQKDLRLVKFDKERKNFGVVTEAVYIKKNAAETFNFLAKYGSKFSSLSNIAHPNDASIFDDESVITYMPFVDKYNFKTGGMQSFNALYHSLNLLPPASSEIIFTYIRDEYINVNGKKTDTERLLVKVKTLPESYIWVSKKDKSIVRLEIKSSSLLIEKIDAPQKITLQDYEVGGESYDSREVIFPSGDIVLAGTVAGPRKEDIKLPGVLFVVGESPYDRENAGLYTDISRELARSGYVVLRFDKRGIGKSQGDYMEVNLFSEIKDIENALSFLSNHEKVDRNKVFIVAHGDGCSYLTQLDFSKLAVKGLVMLGITEPKAILNFTCEYILDRINKMAGLDEKYLGTLDLLKEETLNLIQNTNKEYAIIQGKRIFLKRMSELLKINFPEGFKKCNIPIVIIQGKKDRFYSPDYMERIKNSMEESGFQQYSLVYFRNLGHFFGELVDEKNKAKYYRVNKEVSETIKNWIDSRSAG